MFTIIETEDESSSIFSERYQSCYHSKHGAVRESTHVFIEGGLCFVSAFNKSLKIFEMGFGTGLNAWLTLQKTVELGLNVAYTSLELHPLPPSITSSLSYPCLHEKLPPALFQQLHQVGWEEFHEIHAGFRLKKINANLLEWKPDELYDLVFYDAFGPETQPLLWDENMMAKMAKWLVPNGVLVTFCAKGSFKRALKAAGFEVTSLPGPPGKREMTRAVLK